MKRTRNIFKNIFAVFGVVVFCLIAWLVFISTWSIPSHQLNTYLFQRQFRDAMRPLHPAQSMLIAEAVEFGNFGNSNHCDYFAGEFRSSSLAREEVKNAYRNAPNLSFDGSNYLPVDVYFLDEGDLFDRWPWSGWLEKYFGHRGSVSAEGRYVVFAMSSMHSHAGDFRCW